ncbi:MAG TPA: secretin N-terminal domain-containing protein [Planctomycetota bacterium]|nr:secretin N-terminal domain-containing protein [Planctomycetota bacterium]
MATAQEPEQPGPVTELSERLALSALLDLAAERLGLDVEYDPALLGDEVTLRLRGGLGDEELWALTNRLLASRQLTTVQRPGEGTLGVVRLQDAGRWARIEPELAAARAGFIRYALRLEVLDAAAAAESAKPLLSSGTSQAEALGASGLLLLGDLAPNVRQAAELLQGLDQRGPGTELFERPLAHRKATDVVAQVERALGALDQSGGARPAGRLLAAVDEQSVLVVASPGAMPAWEALIARFDGAPHLETRSYVPRHHSVEAVGGVVRSILDSDPQSTGRARVAPEPLTGTVLVTATPEQHLLVEDLFRRLDAASRESRREVRSFPLENRSSSEVVERLEQLLAAGDLASTDLPDVATAPSADQDPSAPDALATSGPSTDAGASVLAAGLVLTEDPETNRIIGYGEVALLDQVEALLTELDVRRPQVLIEALVVTLTESETRALGVELQRVGEIGGTQVQFASLFGLGSPDLVSDTLPIPVGTGFSGVALDPGDYSILVRALDSVTRGRSMSRPRVLVNNNQPATLDSVLESPFLSTNASDTVATTSYGGSTSAGTSISVTPTLVEGDHLTLQYTVSISTFVGESTDPALPPPRQDNRVESHVTIPDGYTVVVGGLELEESDYGETSVPWLGEIPLLGYLFKESTRSTNSGRFYVFIHAQVMRHDGFADLRYLSDRMKERADLDDGWPRLEPRIIR